MDSLDLTKEPGSDAVTVVIPNRDGAWLLPDCLRALGGQTLRPARIIVVDDHSRDNSREIVERDAVPALWLPLTDGHGFSAAANAGIDAARTKLVALLNSDALPEPEWLEALLRAAREEPEFHAFATRIVRFDRPSEIDSAGLALTAGFGQLCVGGGASDGPEFDGRREVLGACAAAVLYRKTLFTHIGPFDEELGMYWEDYDIALRAQQAGLRTLYVGAARARHRGQATIGRNSRKAVYYYHRNWLPVVVKSDPGLVLRRFPLLAATGARMLALAARRGRLLAGLRGLVAGCFRLRPVLWREVAATRTTGARARLLLLLEQGSRLRRAAGRPNRPPS